MPRQEFPQYKYWAFISYSSRDTAWARWLHRAIEGYGIPAKFVGHPTPVGDPAPRRLARVFRDRDELPASADLGARIAEALEASRFLIVICSPHAARSQWVNREIDLFLQMDRGGRILAVIAGGEPNSRGETECFPPALRLAEPLAADPRPTGDGKTNAKLKIIAGMLGVEFDALRQRDAQRRERRLQVTLALSLFLAAGFAMLGWYANMQRLAAVEQRLTAVQQRDRAIKARQQAEEILQFLLYDLRDKLEPVGRLDIIEDVQEKVEEYHKQLGVLEDELITLYHQVTALTDKGRRLVAQGNLSAAIIEYERAHAILERLAAANAGAARWRSLLSISENIIGDTLLAQGNLSAALNKYNKSMAIQEQLAVEDPANAGWQRDMSVCHEKIGHVFELQGNFKEALAEFEKSRVIREQLTVADPDKAGWRRDLSISHDRIGNVLKAQGNIPGAFASYEKSMAIREQLTAADPDNAGWRCDLSVSHVMFGDVFVAQGNFNGALDAYEKSLAIREQLAAMDPTNTGWRRDLTIAHERIAVVLEKQGNLTGALAAYEKSLEIREQLAAADPVNAGWRSDLSIGYSKVGTILVKQGDIPGALTAYEKSLEIREQLAAANPDNAAWRRDLVLIFVMIAQLYLDADDKPMAREYQIKCRDELRIMKQKGMILDSNFEAFLNELEKWVK